MTEVPHSIGDGRYRVIGVLGEGAQATTYEAVDERSGASVAVKRFRVRGARSWKEVELAEREATVLRGLSHPLLPRYLEHFEEHGELFLVMEKIEGESLSSLRRRGVAFDEEEVMRFLRDAAQALDYLHGRTPPIVHRDLKPGNVLRRPDGSFAFIDFGSVRDRMKAGDASTVVGTFGYMAPEQFQGRAMPASDVYSVGATALALLTRREPEELPHRGLGIDVPAALAGCRVRPELVRVLSAMLTPVPDTRARIVCVEEEPEVPSSVKRRAARRRNRARKAQEQAAAAEAAAFAAAPKTGVWCSVSHSLQVNATGDDPCPNSRCDGGLVGEDLCRVCRGFGKVEPTPRRRRKRQGAAKATTTKETRRAVAHGDAPCPNPSCDGGLVGEEVCGVCGGFGKVEPAEGDRDDDPGPPAVRPATLLSLVAVACLALWSWLPDGPSVWFIIAAPCLLALLAAVSRGAVLLVTWGREKGDAVVGQEGRAAAADAESEIDAELSACGGARCEAPPRSRTRLPEIEDETPTEEEREEPRRAQRAMRT